MVRSLAEAAQKIGEVVKLINDIAAQTNLLALNATIEAARAGDAGKGFAVVANEVKHLANQTAKATEEIGTQITAIQTETQSAVAAISSISGTIENINELSSAIAAAVEEQGAATSEIARSVEQAAHGTAQAAENVAVVSGAAEETKLMSDQVYDAATGLSSNFRAYNFGDNPVTSVVSHFDGITSDGHDGFNLTGDWIGAGESEEGGLAFFAHVGRGADGSFTAAEWLSLSYPGEGNGPTSGNTVYEKYVLGIYVPDGGVPQGYVATVPEIDPNRLGSVLALVLGSLGLLERRRLKTA